MAERRELIRKVRSDARKLGYQLNLAARNQQSLEYGGTETRTQSFLP
jgi:hypothetical protein